LTPIFSALFFFVHNINGLCKWIMKYGACGVWDLPRFQFIFGRRLQYADPALYSFPSSVICNCNYVSIPFCFSLLFSVNLCLSPCLSAGRLGSHHTFISGYNAQLSHKFFSVYAYTYFDTPSSEISQTRNDKKGKIGILGVMKSIG